MTQEEKARAYDEAFKRAKLSRLQLLNIGEEATEIEYIFPKLKESEVPELNEDERIRKCIIKFLIDVNNGAYTKSELEIASWITWLEKQRDEKSIINVPSREVILSIWDLGNEWKELTNGSISTEYGTQLEYIQKHWQESEYYLRTKQDKQKPIDKVNPKFHKGDWIIFNENHNSIYQVERIDNYRYYLRHYLGGTLSLHFDNELIRQWTIADAKDGDVLATENFIFIFKNIDNDNGVHYYCQYEISKHEDDNQFDVALPQSLMGRVGNSIIHYSPATKEQRNILFKEMKKASYEWNTVNKELRKIKQVSSCNEEDEYKLKELNDEKIRIGLINGFKECLKKSQYPKNAQKYWHNIKIEDIFYWLEKQNKEECALKSSKDEDVRKFMQYIEKEAKAYDFNLPNRSYDIYAFAKDILAWLEKQSKKKPTLRERYENIAKSEWFKKTHDGMSISNDEEPKWTNDDEQYLLVCKNALRKYQVSDKWDADIISKWLEDKLK